MLFILRVKGKTFSMCSRKDEIRLQFRTTVYLNIRYLMSILQIILEDFPYLQEVIEDITKSESRITPIAIDNSESTNDDSKVSMGFTNLEVIGLCCTYEIIQKYSNIIFAVYFECPPMMLKSTVQTAR